jgi:hypothetical protein
MKSEERIAQAYLETLGLGPARFEPDGNIPPDFLLSDQIAVEVRRLNQHFEGPDGPEGLEIAEAGIVRFIDKLLPRYGPPSDGRSWFVSYSFRRPLDWRQLKGEVRAALAGFAPTSDAPVAFTFQRRFKMDLSLATHAHTTKFLLGGYSDWQAGGFVGAEIVRNARLCVTEKAGKIARYQTRYPRWWLLLIDRIGSDLDSHERQGLVGEVPHGPWERIILLDPKDSRKSLDL